MVLLRRWRIVMGSGDEHSSQEGMVEYANGRDPPQVVTGRLNA